MSHLVLFQISVYIREFSTAKVKDGTTDVILNAYVKMPPQLNIDVWKSKLLK